MNRPDQAKVHAALAAYYESTLARHGHTCRGVDWPDAASHRLRHEQFLRLLRDEPQASVLDLGCGYGDFLTVLRQHGHRGFYLGCDIAAGMIDAARACHGEASDHAWRCGGDPPEAMDYAIASGIFNVRRGTDPESWRDYVEQLIGRLAERGRLGFGFNMLTTCSDESMRRMDLHYADPVTTLAFCIGRWGRHVALLQDYGLWEFTIIVRHSSQTASPKPVAP